jgi:mono/diheme cytochrome c family protein
VITRRNLTCGVLTLAMAFFLVAGAVAGNDREGAAKTSTAAAAGAKQDEAAVRIEGERRFRANCGRCHQAPHKFPPRMMATVIRHMRVRATITDEDMRLILQYMTQ